MTDRMALIEPIAGIYRVTGSTPPFARPDHVHAYIAETTDGLAVLDATLGWDDSLDRLEAVVMDLGRSLSDVTAVYLTHSHPDHIGLAKQLQEISGAMVFCHPIAQQQLIRMQDMDSSEMVSRFAEHGLADTGGFAEFRERMPMLLAPLPSQIQTIDDGDMLSFAGSGWTVRWTPGHDWGHVVFFRESDCALVAGDALLGEITPSVQYTFEPEDPLGLFLGSLDVLESLDPQMVLPGHGEPFGAGAERVREIRSHHDERLAACIDALGDGARDAMEVALALFGPDLGFLGRHMALTETLAHLEYLRLRSSIDRTFEGGTWRYAARSPSMPIASLVE